VIQEILSSSPDRIDPRCPHFSDCGGCHYQHLPYKNQLQLKRAVLIDQLQRVGRIDQPQVNEMVPSPSCWNYRNHVQFHMTGSGELGFMRHRTNVVVPIQECHLPEENINQIWPILDIELIPGLDRISLRSGEEGQDVLIVFESSDPHPIEFSVDLPLSAVHQGPAGDVILAGDDFTVIEVKDTPFVVSAGAFFQVNTLMAELMVDHLLEVLPLNTESVLLDIYCGVGLFSVFIAPLVKKVVGIESDPKAGEDFLYNLAGFDNVQLYDVSAESILPELKLSPNIIILDPPRTGISKSVMDSVVKLTPEVIAYVSCDPATLARDAGRLSAKGFYLKESTPFDMFPQTYHIESVNIFQRASSEV
jgi:23S rRNA (uracil1939-C5)-methyltransferase